MVDDLLVARNPDPDSSLPYLVRIPLGPAGIVVKARDTWPKASKVYCHRADGWPEDAEIVERHPVRSCTRRGPAIDLVLDRARQNRSQLVLTRARGREVIFWQSPSTAKQARPACTCRPPAPPGRCWRSSSTPARSTPTRSGTSRPPPGGSGSPAGDYAVELDGAVVAAVERKSVTDLAGSLLSGKLTYALAELSALPRAAVVVEDRYSRLFTLEHVSGSRSPRRWPRRRPASRRCPIVFCETRPLAQEWTYRWLGACLVELSAAAAYGRPSRPPSRPAVRCRPPPLGGLEPPPSVRGRGSREWR